MADPAPSPSPNPPPAATAKGAPPPRRGALRRLGASFGVYLAGVVAVALLAAAALGWVLLTESGAQWLLARVPGLQASGVSGSVLGRFSAQQLDLQLPDGGMRVAVHQLSWSAPRLRWGSGSVWLNLEFDELQAQRIELWPSSQPDGEPVTAPTRLDFPLGLQVEALRIGELRIEGLDPPLRELGARVALGTDGGALHRIDALSLAWDRLRLSGQAQLATRGDLALDAALQITQQAAPQATAPSAPAAAVGAATAADTAADTAEWSAALQLNGPLTSPHLRATLPTRRTPPKSRPRGSICRTSRSTAISAAWSMALASPWRPWIPSSSLAANPRTSSISAPSTTRSASSALFPSSSTTPR